MCRRIVCGHACRGLISETHSLLLLTLVWPCLLRWLFFSHTLSSACPCLPVLSILPCLPFLVGNMPKNHANIDINTIPHTNHLICVPQPLTSFLVTKQSRISDILFWVPELTARVYLFRYKFVRKWHTAMICDIVSHEQNSVPLTAIFFCEREVCELHENSAGTGVMDL